MNAAEHLARIYAAGVELKPGEGGHGVAVVSGKLSDRQRYFIRAHQVALAERLGDAEVLAEALLLVAARVSDAWHDSDAAREALRLDVAGTPPEERMALLRYLCTAYPVGAGALDTHWLMKENDLVEE